MNDKTTKSLALALAKKCDKTLLLEFVTKVINEHDVDHAEYLLGLIAGINDPVVEDFDIPALENFIKKYSLYENQTLKEDSVKILEVYPITKKILVSYTKIKDNTFTTHTDTVSYDWNDILKQ